MVRISKINTEGNQLQAAIQLFKDYHTELNVDLCFQNFDAELKHPLKLYGEPHGCLLIAFFNDVIIGCVALKKIEDTICEMKRLYVKPEFRKLKAGKILVEKILDEAKQLGYTKMKLDTLQTLTAAVGLYQKLGFENTTAYYNNPLNDVVYMEKEL